MKIDNQLIVDVGMHTGRDAEFYLKKGFNVVGVEANPQLANQVRSRLQEFIANGKLTICEIAIAGYRGEIEFFINDKQDDWGTISPEFAARNERLGTTNHSKKMPCDTFNSILERHGIPYFLKIDIEGADHLCLEALKDFRDRPKYVSVEASLDSFDEVFSELSLLWSLGYRRFKIANQIQNHKIRCPNPPREGNYVDARFDSACSGPFGEEVPGPWLTIEETIVRYRKKLAEQRIFGGEGSMHGTVLQRVYEILHRERVGWYDFHARLE